MKKALLTLMSLVVVAFCHAKPNIGSLSYPTTVDLFGMVEVSFQLDDYPNPYDPEVIHAYAVFNGPQNQTFVVDAFYYQGYRFTQSEKKYQEAQPLRDDKGWRVRFTPDAVGEWSFTLVATDKNGTTTLTTHHQKPMTFQCVNVPSANGFITKANTRFLKRETVKDGHRQEEPFFPVGPNVGWYGAADYGRYEKPYGIYDYVWYINKLSGNANYFRMWINRYQCLSIYGPEHTELENGMPKMYFDNQLNQKDAAELDFIIQYAKQHDIAMMTCFFNFRNFFHESYVSPATKAKPAMPSDWINNPFHTVLGLQSPFQFFTDAEAKRITKNLIRYMVARWGYATNILAWELWNEVANMTGSNTLDSRTQHEIIRWHEEMSEFIRSIDPYHHLISTSTGSSKWHELYAGVFEKLDFVQKHDYQNIQKASSKEQISAVLYRHSLTASEQYPDKPFFMGEYGFGQSKDAPKYEDKDPYGIDMHNTLWSSTFSGTMGPASFWYWEVLKKKDLFHRYGPIRTFLGSLPILSDSFRPETTGEELGRSMVFPHNLETYYMINAAEDSIMGWSQDTAFCYQSLRRLTDAIGSNRHFADGKVTDPKGYVYTLDATKRPRASSRDNTISIPIDKQPVGTRYLVRWFDSETGLELTSETTTAEVQGGLFRQRSLSFEFPRSIRDPRTGAVNNTFGDAVFMLSKELDPSNESKPADKPTRRIKVLKR